MTTEGPSQKPSRRRVGRSIRGTSLYQASLGLYGVLVGLALFSPLELFASDVLADPLNGNWSMRFLAVGLFAEVGIWFHALAAEMGLQTLTDVSAERHEELPGLRSFSPYHTALLDFWLGAVVVVLLILLAEAVRNGVSTFLAVFVVYSAWDGLWSGIYLVRHHDDAVKSWRGWRSPPRLVKLVRSERHVPATTEDLAILSASSPRVEIMWVNSVWLSLLISLTFVVWTTILFVVAVNTPGADSGVSLAWLVSVVAAILADYALLPQYYSA